MPLLPVTPFKRKATSLALRGLALCLALGLAVGCTADGPARRASLAPSGRVLIVTASSGPTAERLVSLLAAGGQGSPPLSPIAADVAIATDPAQATAAVRSPLQPIERYRAIYTTSITSARAAQIVAPNVPIVFEGVDDPVARCLVDSLQRPGRNATGYMHYLPDDEFKMIELLHDAYPSLRKALFLVAGDNLPPPSCDPADPYWTTPQTEPCTPGERALDAYVQRRVRGAELVEFASTRGLDLRFAVVCGTQDFGALAALGGSRFDRAWVVPWHTLFDKHRAELLRPLNASGLPAVYPHHGYTRAGGLMSLGMLLDDGADRASFLTLLRVLNGVNPATEPVQTPRGFSVVVNARTAAQLPVRPSLLVLRRADEILR